MKAINFQSALQAKRTRFGAHERMIREGSSTMTEGTLRNEIWSHKQPQK
jgi:hypothetical protein